MKRGRFIALEGGEGTGKSTQSRLLAQYLDECGISVVTTREPGGTPGAEAVRALLLDPPDRGWNPRAEALLFAAARSDHVERLVVPALNEGKWVICDRFVDSSRAYQGAAGGLDDAAIMALHAFGSKGLLPDLTLILTVPQADVSARIARRDGDMTDAIGGRDADYHAAVGAAFHRFAEAEPNRFAVIDGLGDPGQVHKRILSALVPLLERVGDADRT